MKKNVLFVLLVALTSLNVLTMQAQSKAKTLAEAVGQTVGKAIFIREDSYIPYTPKSRFRLPNVIMLCDSGADEDEALPELEFEKYKLSCDVSVKFELE